MFRQWKLKNSLTKFHKINLKNSSIFCGNSLKCHSILTKQIRNIKIRWWNINKPSSCIAIKIKRSWKAILPWLKNKRRIRNRKMKITFMISKIALSKYFQTQWKLSLEESSLILVILRILSFTFWTWWNLAFFMILPVKIRRGLRYFQCGTARNTHIKWRFPTQSKRKMANST